MAGNILNPFSEEELDTHLSHRISAVAEGTAGNETCGDDRVPQLQSQWRPNRRFASSAGRLMAAVTAYPEIPVSHFVPALIFAGYMMNVNNGIFEPQSFERYIQNKQGIWVPDHRGFLTQQSVYRPNVHWGKGRDNCGHIVKAILHPEEYGIESDKTTEVVDVMNQIDTLENTPYEGPHFAGAVGIIRSASNKFTLHSEGVNGAAGMAVYNEGLDRDSMLYFADAIFPIVKERYEVLNFEHVHADIERADTHLIQQSVQRLFGRLPVVTINVDINGKYTYLFS